MHRSIVLFGLIVCLLTITVAEAQKPWQSSGLFEKGATVVHLTKKGVKHARIRIRSILNRS